ncbi:hypothetical protein [Jiangella anatolica]|uniref:WxL domain-containing protein n=1 Tax=Jiangella anatolica TaxID=2670374 RepID=A0A2W2BKC0_9ACTN|nr:hypothetical protein [Jiangella anatolica]PZF86462.1 hypothetical protein C1I92_01235 [Jiangella anatolica]
MSTRHIRPRLVLAALGLVALGLAGSATAAVADEEEGVDLSVVIDDITPPGQLTLTVAPNDGVVLTENGSDDNARQFTGTLPTVTVSDTRTPEEIPDGAFWAVVGQAGDFAGGDNTIGAEHLGWRPRLLTPSPTGNVTEGEPVSSVISDGTGAPAVGLVGQELLISTFSAEEETGSWNVDAELALRTPADVEPGEYHSVLTLSLFDQ